MHLLKNEASRARNAHLKHKGNPAADYLVPWASLQKKAIGALNAKSTLESLKKHYQVFSSPVFKEEIIKLLIQYSTILFSHNFWIL